MLYLVISLKLTISVKIRTTWLCGFVYMLCIKDWNQNLGIIIEQIQVHYVQNGKKNPFFIKINLLKSRNSLKNFEQLAQWGLIYIKSRHLVECLCVLMEIELNENFHQIIKELEFFYENGNKNNQGNQKALVHIQPNKLLSFSGLEKEKMQLSNFCLKEDIKHIENNLKHFLKIGALSNEDFHLLSMNIKMFRSFLSRDFKIPQKRKANISKNSCSKQQPLPIMGEISITGLNERLDALKPVVEEKNCPKFPYKIPAGTHWNNIIMKFLDNENVEIHVKKQKHLTNYKEMGMVGKGKIPLPSEQWVFLRVLSQLNGELTVKDTEAKDKYKKHKQGLSETLRSYFNIDYDPFYPYSSTPEKTGNSYKIKLFLIPPPKEKQCSEPVQARDFDPLGIREYLDETAPLLGES